MSQTITIEVPDLIAARYSTRDELRHGIYEGMVISEFQQGFLTIREGAKLLGLTYEGFLEWLGARKLPFAVAASQELDESYQNFSLYLQSIKR